MNEVTTRQKQVLEAIIYLTDTKNYPPTVRELCEYLDLKSSSTMQNHLIQLKRKGRITWQPKTPRTVRVVHHNEAST